MYNATNICAISKSLNTWCWCSNNMALVLKIEQYVFWTFLHLTTRFSLGRHGSVWADIRFFRSAIAPGSLPYPSRTQKSIRIYQKCTTIVKNRRKIISVVFSFYYGGAPVLNRTPPAGKHCFPGQVPSLWPRAAWGTVFFLARGRAVTQDRSRN